MPLPGYCQHGYCQHARLEMFRQKTTGIVDDPMTPNVAGIKAEDMVVPMAPFYKCLDCGAIQVVVLQMTLSRDYLQLFADHINKG